MQQRRTSQTRARHVFRHDFLFRGSRPICRRRHEPQNAIMENRRLSAGSTVQNDPVSLHCLLAVIGVKYSVVPKVYEHDYFSWLPSVRVGKRVLRVRRSPQHDTVHLHFYAGSARIFYKSRTGAGRGRFVRPGPSHLQPLHPPPEHMMRKPSFPYAVGILHRCEILFQRTFLVKRNLKPPCRGCV